MKNINLIILFLLFVINIHAQDNHPIIGAWQLTSVDVNGKTETGMQAVWIFEKGGELMAARSPSGKGFSVGKWECDEDLKILIMESTVDKDFNGEAKILNLNEGKLAYEKDEAVLNFVKAEMKKPDNTPIPELGYSYMDFLDSDGGDKYLEDGDKLPWTLDQIYVDLKNVKEMVYNIDHFVPNHGKTDSWTNSYKTEYLSPTELSIREYSYFQNDYVDMDEKVFPLDDETQNQKVFFPMNDPEFYRVIGIEDYKTSLGVFKCTVVEGIGDFDLKVKYWMINNKPGVFAKIIKSKTEGNPLGYTNVYELKEIK